MPNYVQAAANQSWQLGQESSPGTGTTAGHVVKSLIVVPTEKLNVTKFMSPGHHYTTETALEQQWTETAITGDGSFTEVLWLLEALFGTVSPTTPGGATIARKRIYTPPLTGAIVPKTFFTQWGDANNVNGTNYNLVKDLNMKLDRVAGVSLSGAGLAQLQTAGATFTASPTALANRQMSGAMLNFYLDTSGANIGVTQQQLTIQSAEVDYKGGYDVYWDADRAQPTWATHVNDNPAMQVKVDFNENANTRTLFAALVLQTTYFLRIDVTDSANSIETGQPFTFQWDLAVRLMDKAPYGTKQKVLYRTATFEVVEDTTWGKAHQITSITGEATL